MWWCVGKLFVCCLFSFGVFVLRVSCFLCFDVFVLLFVLCLFMFCAFDMFCVCSFVFFCCCVFVVVLLF